MAPCGRGDADRTKWSGHVTKGRTRTQNPSESLQTCDSNTTKRYMHCWWYGACMTRVHCVHRGTHTATPISSEISLSFMYHVCPGGNLTTTTLDAIHSASAMDRPSATVIFNSFAQTIIATW